VCVCVCLPPDIRLTFLELITSTYLRHQVHVLKDIQGSFNIFLLNLTINLDNNNYYNSDDLETFVAVAVSDNLQ